MEVNESFALDFDRELSLTGKGGSLHLTGGGRSKCEGNEVENIKLNCAIEA